MVALSGFDPGLDRHVRRFGASPHVRLIVYGFAYWVVIVAALEPGNMVNMRASGVAFQWDRELIRILCAGLLGAGTAPVVMQLSQRFPVAEPHLQRNGLVHAVCALGLATTLIVLAHVLAAWLFAPGQPVTMAGLQTDLTANELLLVSGLLGFSALAHLVLRRSTVSPTSTPRPDATKHEPAGVAASAPSPLGAQAVPIECVEIRVRGVLRHVPVGEIDWIECQGNYLALHVGSATLMMRDTLVGFESRLDRARFIRIHRRTIIAIDRMASIQPAANGDGVVRLRNGQALKVSRNYRKALGATIVPRQEAP